MCRIFQKAKEAAAANAVAAFAHARCLDLAAKTYWAPRRLNCINKDRHNIFPGKLPRIRSLMHAIPRERKPEDFSAKLFPRSNDWNARSLLLPSLNFRNILLLKFEAQHHTGICACRFLFPLSSICNMFLFSRPSTYNSTGRPTHLTYASGMH